jgi:hypothetical protein
MQYRNNYFYSSLQNPNTFILPVLPSEIEENNYQ